MTKPALSLFVALLLVACDNVAIGPQGHGAPGTGPLPDDPTLCNVVERVFEPSCVGCHGAGAPLDLRSPAELIDAPSVAYPDAVLVVPGDAESSLLYRKLSGPAEGEGASMPLGGALDGDLVELVRTWIDAGAQTDCEPPEASDPTDPADPADLDDGAGACAVFAARCTGCHNGGPTFPDLRADALPALADTESPTYPGAVLVVPGVPEESLLFHKVAGTQGDQGARMPLGGELAQEEIDVIEGWIATGASACEGDVDDLPPPEEPVIEPGEPIDVGSPPSGFTTSPPWFADGERCSTGQWWRHPGDEEEGPGMHPGRSCISCHAASDDDDAPRFRYAGTVMNDLRDEDDCRGVPGVQVEIIDVDGSLLGATQTNSAGNFFFRRGDIEASDAFRVRLSYDGRTREMHGPQSSGDCMSCHTQQGDNGAPGRIVAP